MSPCVFCQIVQGSAPCQRVYEDEDTFAFLDIAPAVEGHTLVIPKEHCTDLTDIGQERAAAVMRSAIHVAAVLRRALEPEGMNLVHSSGRAAWQSVFHFHLHLLPRHASDGLTRPWIPEPRTLESLAGIGDRVRAAATAG
jgi:histidine triad (HIT) family protein